MKREKRRSESGIRKRGRAMDRSERASFDSLRFHKILVFIFISLFSFSCATAEAAVRYVKWNATGANNGTSWTDAYTDLQPALSAAVAGDDIWVSAGTYKPTTGTNRNATFQLKNGVEMYGGFPATGSPIFADRNPASYPTILSGDIDGDDNQTPIITDILSATGNSTNSYHVVTGASGATLDGFTITAGYANGTSPNDRGGGMYNNNSSPTVTNVTFSGSLAGHGGGMYNENSSPTLIYVTFSSNQATGDGGGIYNNGGTPTLTQVIFSFNFTFYGRGGGMRNYQSSPTITYATFSDNSANWGGGVHNYQSAPVFANVTFSGNSGSDNGGGIGNEQSSPWITNVTFSGNWAYSRGAGMDNYDNSNPRIRNTIFWGDSTDPEIANVTSSNPVVSYSVVEGGYAGGTNIITADPLLGAPGNYGGFTRTIPLLPGSSAINTGNAAYCVGTTDQRGVHYVGTCDIGAFESRGFTFTNLTGTPQSANMNAVFPTPLGLTVTANGSGEPVDGGVVTFIAPESNVTITVTSFTLTISGGSVSQTVTANNTYGGPYGVTATTPGATDAYFYLTNLFVPTLHAAQGGLTIGPCDSWGNACELRYALNLALSGSGQAIWVAAGTYKPTAVTTDREATFQLKTGVALYGGFPTTGDPDFADRDPATYLSILSGDIDNDDLNSDGNNIAERAELIGGSNSYHVVKGANGATLDGFTITAGNTGDNGGGMYNNNSSSTVTNVTFSGNAARKGGGMSNENSAPTLTNVTFNGNLVTSFYIGLTLFLGEGGGIYNSGSNPNLTNVIFDNNGAKGCADYWIPSVWHDAYGAGIYNENSSPTLTGVTSQNNWGGIGPGMYNDHSSPLITKTTIDHNMGIGIYNLYSDPTLANTTISDNSGWGIYDNGNDNSTILKNVTVTGNAGGGMYSNAPQEFTVIYPKIYNSLFWGNSGTQIGGLAIRLNSTVSDSVVEGGCPGSFPVYDCTNVINSNPFLGTLADNGGSTQTMALQSGSSAIDAGNDATCAAAPVNGEDQRGVTRPQGDHCDIGAYEFVPTTSTSVVSSLNPSPYGESITFTATVTDSEIPSEPTGTVVFRADGTTIDGCAAVPLSSGQAQCSTSALNGGDHSITAEYVSNSSFSGSISSAITQTVNKFDQTITFNALSDRVYGESFTVSATGGASGNPVTFSVVEGPATATGENGSLITTTGTGAVRIRASQNGNDTYNPAVPVEQSFVVNKAAATTTLSLNSGTNPSLSGESVEFKATVTSDAGTPTGTIAFRDGGIDIPGCGGVTLSSGTALCATASLSEGSHSITAVYSGDAKFNGSTSPVLSHSVLQTYTISFGVGGGSGSFFCDKTTVNSGDDVSCTIAPVQGWYLSTLMDGTADVTASVWDGTYLLLDVSSDHTLTATFERYPIRRTNGGENSYHLTLQSAFAACLDGDDILSLTWEYSEDLDFASGCDAALIGGLETDFSTQSGCTTINGTLIIQIGSMVLDSIIIK